MEPEIEAVIEVEAEQINSTESESISNSWYSAAQIQGILNLNKAMLQSSIAKLIDIYGIPIGNLRRGNARATQYSELAVSAIELLNARKFSELRRLVGESPAIVSTSPSIPCSALAVSNHISTLEGKIALLRQTSTANSVAIGDRIRAKLAEIAFCDKSANEQNTILSEAELLAADNRGIEQGLAIFSAQEAAKENTIAHLRAMKISGNQ